MLRNIGEKRFPRARSRLRTDHELQFKERQRKYFAERLEQKWQCDVLGHTVCVPTVDGQHHQLSDEGFAAWVDALVRIHPVPTILM